MPNAYAIEVQKEALTRRINPSIGRRAESRSSVVEKATEEKPRPSRHVEVVRLIDLERRARFGRMGFDAR